MLNIMNECMQTTGASNVKWTTQAMSRPPKSIELYIMITVISVTPFNHLIVPLYQSGQLLGPLRAIVRNKLYVICMYMRYGTE